MAPLGICFPFPFHCRLLDTAIKSQADISAILVKAGGPTGESVIYIVYIYICTYMCVCEYVRVYVY